jgi:hypothetical protein
MKTNVTLKLDKDLLREARVVAAEQGRSLSAFLTEQLEAIVRDRKAFDRARRRGRTKTAVLREILDDALRSRGGASLRREEARGQSLLVSTRSSERETLAFLDRVQDTGGWE